MERIKNNDFIEVEYTGKLKEDNSVFDTTDADVAKKSGMHDEKSPYGPVVVCVGKGHLLKGIDSRIVGKEAGGQYDFELGPEEAFGNKDAKLVQLIPTGKFRQNKIQPFPGLQINIDGLLGTVKTVSGGRTLVDFNHPLAGKQVLYNVRVKRIVNEDREKILALLKLGHGHKDGDYKIDIKESSAEIKLPHKMPKEIEDKMGDEIKSSVPSIRKIVFTTEEEKKDTPNK